MIKITDIIGSSGDDENKYDWSKSRLRTEWNQAELRWRMHADPSILANLIYGAVLKQTDDESIAKFACQVVTGETLPDKQPPAREKLKQDVLFMAYEQISYLHAMGIAKWNDKKDTSVFNCGVLALQYVNEVFEGNRVSAKRLYDDVKAKYGNPAGGGSYWTGRAVFLANNKRPPRDKEEIKEMEERFSGLSSEEQFNFVLKAYDEFE